MSQPTFDFRRRWVIEIEQFSRGGSMHVIISNDKAAKNFALRSGESFQLNVNTAGVQSVTEKQERKEECW